MKSARIITRVSKNLNLHTTAKNIAVPVIKRKIKEALKEVELIEAGIIKPKSLDDLLDEL